MDEIQYSRDLLAKLNKEVENAQNALMLILKYREETLKLLSQQTVFIPETNCTSFQDEELPF